MPSFFLSNIYFLAAFQGEYLVMPANPKLSAGGIIYPEAIGACNQASPGFHIFVYLDIGRIPDIFPVPDVFGKFLNDMPILICFEFVAVTPKIK